VLAANLSAPIPAPQGLTGPAELRLCKVEPTALQTAATCLLTCNDAVTTLTSPRIHRPIRIGMLVPSST